MVTGAAGHDEAAAGAMRIEAPVFPGGTAVSGLYVYPWPAADDLCGGSPHVHLACTEAYVVVEGEGTLHTLTSAGPSRTPLRPGTVAWFGPGTIHRAVNGDGRLRAVVVMQNAGLPEAGDAVLTFPSEILADPDAYARAAALANAAASHAADEKSARERRDLAVEGFSRLVERTVAGDMSALCEFYKQAVALRRDRIEAWRQIWRSGPVNAVERTEGHFDAIARGDIEHLVAAGLSVRQPPAPEQRAFGMCGRLDTYDLRPPSDTVI
jgi:mannose-6-phosphate isomerase-like protein (cupin superfamily)